MKLRVGETYKYKELCEILKDEPRTGTNSRKSQFKEWNRYFRWSNPTTQKFLIEEIYDTPKEKVDGRKNNGGKREGAGKPPKLQEEFNCLFNYFLKCEYNKNQYLRNNSHWNTSYFNLHDLEEFFGLSNNFYSAKNDDLVNMVAYLNIAEMIDRRARSWLINKIKRREENTENEIVFTEGIIAYRRWGDKVGDYKDEYLQEWKKHQLEYFDKTGLKNAGAVMYANKWKNMLEYISSFFKNDGYELVKKYKKIIFNPTKLHNYNYDECERCKQKINDTIVKELYDYFLNKEYNKYIKNQTEIKDEMEGFIEVCGWLNEYYDGALSNPTETDEYKELELQLCEFNEELVMTPYKYIIDGYVRIQSDS